MEFRCKVRMRAPLHINALAAAGMWPRGTCLCRARHWQVRLSLKSGAPPSLPRWTQRLRKTATPFHSILFTHDARSWGSLQVRLGHSSNGTHAGIPKCGRGARRGCCSNPKPHVCRARHWQVRLSLKSGAPPSLPRWSQRLRKTATPFHSIIFTHDARSWGSRQVRLGHSSSGTHAGIPKCGRGARRGCCSNPKPHVCRARHWQVRLSLKSGAPPSLPRWSQRLRKTATPFHSILFTHDARSWGSRQVRLGHSSNGTHAGIPKCGRGARRGCCSNPKPHVCRARHWQVRLSLKSGAPTSLPRWTQRLRKTATRLFSQSYSPTTQGRGGLCRCGLATSATTLRYQGEAYIGISGKNCFEMPATSASLQS